MSNKTVIIIAGPTAVGKTSVAIDVAQHFTTQIISADSRQCFKELNIGVARPSEEELSAVPHYFIASHSILQKVTAVSFEEYALEKVAEIFNNNDVAVMVGGTGLYIKAFCEGMDVIPEVPEAIHEEVGATYREQGMEWLQQQIQLHDPLFWQQGEIKNPQRMMRALEVFRATGQSVLHFRKGEKKQRNFRIIKTALELPKESLHQNINRRVDKMMEDGLLKEVENLLPNQHLNALQTVGYKELFEYFNQQISLDSAVEAIKQNTRQYAKRQLTWFRKDKDYQWFLPEAEDIIKYVETRL